VLRSDYHFLTRWRVRATPDEVFAILSAPLDYPRWWPAVYISVRAMLPGSKVSLLTKGWLPYQLRWVATTTESQPPHLLAFTATGDFEGRGIWSIVADGPFTDITFDWKITASKQLLRYLGLVLRPAFEANHRWAMAQGEKSLELELQRTRAWNVEQMNAIEPPPEPINSLQRMWKSLQPPGLAH